MDPADAVSARTEEHAFRVWLAAVVDDLAVSLPAGLREAVAEHLHRRDSAGYSLCFANPARERLLVELALYGILPQHLP